MEGKIITELVKICTRNLLIGLAEFTFLSRNFGRPKYAPTVLSVLLLSENDRSAQTKISFEMISLMGFNAAPDWIIPTTFNFHVT